MSQSDPQIMDQINELIGEIAFQKCLLESLDKTISSREVVEADINEEIRSLQRQVTKLRRSTKTGGLASSQATFSQAFETTASLSTPKREEGGSTAGALDSILGQNEWASLGSSPASTPNTADASAPISPSRKDFSGRKRTYSTHLDGSLASSRESKRRITPSSSIASSGDEEDFLDIQSEYYNKQAELQQERNKQRALQEQQDAALARSLSQQQPMPPPAISGPSAFNRISGIRNPSTPTAFGTSSQMSSRIKQEVPSMYSGVKTEPRHEPSFHSAYSPFAQDNHVKAEPSSSKSMPGQFRDHSSDASDSDIEIIPKSAFLHSTFGLPPKSEPKSEPTFLSETKRVFGQAASLSKDVLSTALYGRSPSMMNTPTPRVASASSLPNMLTTPGDGYGSAPGLPVSTFQPLRPGNFVYPRANSATPSNMGGMTTLPGRANATASGNVQRAIPGANYFGSATGLLGMAPPPDLEAEDPFTTTAPLGAASLGTTAGRPVELSDSDMDSHMSDSDHNMIRSNSDFRRHPAMVPPSDDLKALLDNIKSEGDDILLEAREETPEGLKYPLYEHQKIALTWLKAMETGSNKGGILADDMGLGKTISSLALILSRPSSNRARKTTLIVGPVSLLRQWEQEIRKKVKASHRLTTYMMHGIKRKLTWSEVQGFDIVLTSYGTLASELKQMEKWTLAQQAEHGGGYDQAPMAAKFPLLGPRSFFYRVILDEAHCIKNKTTNSAKAACELKSTYRLSLSGTPMQNNPDELYSQIHFLRIKPYNEWSRWRDQFSCLSGKDKNKRNVEPSMRKFQVLIKAILLRRTKTSLIDGKPIITLPPKTEMIQHVVFNTDENDYYRALESKTQIVFNRYLRANTVGKNYSNILVLLLRLRQACCHPHLIMDFEEAPPAGSNIDENAMIELAKTLSPEVIHRLLESEAFECPVCYDATENPRIIVPCGHDTCSECLTKIRDQAAQNHAAEGNEGNATLVCKCPSCRGELHMDKILDFVTFKKIHQPEEVDEDPIVDVEQDSDNSETDSESDDYEEDDDSGDDLKDFVVPDDMIEDPSSDGDDEAEVPKSKPKKQAKKVKLRRREKGKEKAKATHVSLAMLKKEAHRSAKHHRKYFRYLTKHYQPSAKVDKCVELLEQFQNDGQKTIVFSLFTTLLDLVQVPLSEKKFSILRYDGSMSADARNAAIVSFTEKADQNIMLISLKAGNAGLNLVAASRVIILDPFWNPYIEMQAIDRAYRIGQLKPVEVHRILVKGTVEDRILELQERKRALVDAALDEGASKELARLGPQQLAFLFGVRDNL